MPIDLCNVIDENIFIVPDQSQDGKQLWKHRIMENEDSGKMNLTVIIPDRFLRIDLPRQNVFFLKNQKCADGVIWEYLKEKCYRLHLFEMKRTMKPQTWIKIKEQFHGAYLRCRMIANLLEWDIDKYVALYTVFYRDMFEHTSIEGTDFVFEHISTNTNVVREKLEWDSDQCDIRQLGLPSHFGTPYFRHYKVALNNLNSDGIPEGIFVLPTF
ncbi:MAG: hypothetical protein LBQ50_11445 [Planctomycetaceae bacterium]|jgi:hypothetical protein|nr:hypothetical protein [Planctomycetaceae bacterium]